MFVQRLVIVFAMLVSASAVARDLGLAEAERLMREHNRELIAARRALESAAAQRDIAAVRPNPTLSLNSSSISSNPGTGPGPLNQKRIDTVLRIDQPIERGGKRELRMDAAEGLEQAARGDALDALRTQLAALRGAYYDLKQAEEKVQILAETAQLFGRTLAAAQARLKAGDLAAADVAKVQVDYELRASDAWPAIEKPAPDVLERALQRAVEERPDVVAARARVSAAEKLRDLARSQQTRDITIGAQYERYPTNIPSDSIGIGISLPLFTGNDFSADIRRAEVDRYAAIDALDRTRLVAGNELRRAAADLAAAADRLERYDASLLEAAQRTAQAVEFAFQRGATSVLEVLDARRTLRAVRLEALAARTDHAKALAAWRASLTTVDMLGEK